MYSLSKQAVENHLSGITEVIRRLRLRIDEIKAKPERELKEKFEKVIYASGCTANTYNKSLNCTTQKRISPGKMLMIEVPMELRGKEIDIVSIQQFQNINTQPAGDKTGWDSKPAFASFQVYSLDKNEIDNWRFYGGPIRRSPPKGSFFSERIDPAQADQSPVQQLDFDAHDHKGHLMEKASNNPINAYAIRIMNVGSDDLYLHNLTVSFK